jgi:8-oxo-dGTP diphosphatase/2-hydroxy-dATP diphosphatase
MIYDHPKILLGMKKRGFGAGKWNGFGGKVAPGETIEQAAQRELAEESGIIAEEMEKFGIINYQFEGDPDILQVHMFKLNEFSGEPSETEEMQPRWFNIDEIPFRQMWHADVYWMPLFLQGKKFKGKFLLSKLEAVLEHELEEVNEL